MSQLADGDVVVGGCQTAVSFSDECLKCWLTRRAARSNGCFIALTGCHAEGGTDWQSNKKKSSIHCIFKSWSFLSKRQRIKSMKAVSRRRRRVLWKMRFVFGTTYQCEGGSKSIKLSNVLSAEKNKKLNISKYELCTLWVVIYCPTVGKISWLFVSFVIFY